MDQKDTENALAKRSLDKLVTPVTETFGLSWTLAAATVLFSGALLAAAIFYFIHSAPPHTLTISSGPAGSKFEAFAEQYRDILKRNHVTLKIVPSEGSEQNLERLDDKQSDVQVGFVQGGVTNALAESTLMSLGSLSYQPLLIFYRGTNVMNVLAELKGKKLALGPAGSGTRTLATTLLGLNSVDVQTNATLVDLDPTNAVAALQSGTVDAVFLMGDSASPAVMGKLVKTDGVHIYSFTQADGYTRKISYLTKLEVPMGSIDFGKNIPAQDVYLVGPTVELLAKKKLHPALSDLLLEAAREVNGPSGLLQKKNEFPAPLEHDFKLSPDAVRFYTEKKGFLYQYLPYWLASLVSRILVVFVPLVLLLVPSLKAIPALYKWRIRMVIYRRYRALLALERELDDQTTIQQRDALLKRLDQIEGTVNVMKVPASFANDFYGLRGHINFVRGRLAEHAQLN